MTNRRRVIWLPAGCLAAAFLLGGLGCGGRRCEEESRSTGIGGSLFRSCKKKKSSTTQDGAGGAPGGPSTGGSDGEADEDGTDEGAPDAPGGVGAAPA